MHLNILLANSNSQIYNRAESIVLISSRWSKLNKEFYDKETKQFNISKIPDIYDTVRHDYHRNKKVYENLDPNINLKMYKLSRLLAHFVVCN